jgi:uncharacterized membrane protein
MQLAGYTFGCHGIPERCFSIRGRHMPFCARCVGASIGHVACAVCYLAFTLPAFYLAFPGLAIMFADWYSQNKRKLYHSNLMRLVTGIAGGYGMGLIIWKIVAQIIKFIIRL